ncbi:MAG: PH domain-containing protein [Lachnospiraceae bacterium]|nr:PH domain-containing protein [Lachnospiraceae bacterium]
MGTQYEEDEEDDIIWEDRKHIAWFPIGFEKYTVRDGKIYINKGLFSTVSDQTLLYRVIDIQLRRTLRQKIFGTGTIILISRVDADPEIVLENVKDSRYVMDMLSELVEEEREKRNVVGKEFYADAFVSDGDGDFGGMFDD